ncbi:MAG: hypothetical protein ACO294_07565 [Methylococcales bacterium]
MNPLELTEDNFTYYAIRHYDNPSCRGIAEFNDDLKRFRYLKRLFKKYDAGQDLRERLILNHLVVIYNLFGGEASTKMLFFKIEKQFWPQLKTFLVFLNYMPIGPISAQGITIEGYEIPIDDKVATALGKI